jgi:hypothetical protein
MSVSIIPSNVEITTDHLRVVQHAAEVRHAASAAHAHASHHVGEPASAAGRARAGHLIVGLGGGGDARLRALKISLER